MPDVARVHKDRALTQYVQGLLPNQVDYVSRSIFPSIRVPNRTDDYYIFDAARRAFADARTLRAPGAEAEEVDFDLTDASFRTDAQALSAFVPDEETLNADAPIAPMQDKVQQIISRLMVGREIRTVTTLAAGITQTSDPTQEWDDPVNGDPMADAILAKQAVQDATGGKTPNICVMDSKVLDALKEHPQVIERVKAGGNNQNPAQVYKLAIAALFEVDELLVSKAIKNTAIEGQTASFSRVWGTDVYFLYVNRGADPQKYQASFGYNFLWRPSFVKRWREDGRSGEKVQVESNYVDVVTLAAAGYRLQNRIG